MLLLTDSKECLRQSKHNPYYVLFTLSSMNRDCTIETKLNSLWAKLDVYYTHRKLKGWCELGRERAWDYSARHPSGLPLPHSPLDECTPWIPADTFDPHARAVSALLRKIPDEIARRTSISQRVFMFRHERRLQEW